MDKTERSEINSRKTLNTLTIHQEEDIMKMHEVELCHFSGEFDEWLQLYIHGNICYIYPIQ